MATRTAEEIKRDAEKERLALRRYPSHQAKPEPVAIDDGDTEEVRRAKRRFPSLFRKK